MENYRKKKKKTLKFSLYYFQFQLVYTSGKKKEKPLITQSHRSVWWCPCYLEERSTWYSSHRGIFIKSLQRECFYWIFIEFRTNHVVKRIESYYLYKQGAPFFYGSIIETPTLCVFSLEKLYIRWPLRNFPKVHVSEDKTLKNLCWFAKATFTLISL